MPQKYKIGDIVESIGSVQRGTHMIVTGFSEEGYVQAKEIFPPRYRSGYYQFRATELMKINFASKAKIVAERCSDAYSVRRYGSWVAVAKALLQKGYNAQEAEGIMRSKYTRWAADSHGAKYGKVPAKAITDYLDGVRDDVLTADVAEFVSELPQNQIQES